MPNFKKAERLSGRKLIASLFAEGLTLYIFPFKLYYLTHVEGSVNSIMVSVPKRNFKKAVDRNLMKRRIREAYRVNKSILDRETKYLLGYIYVAKEKLPYEEIAKKMAETLQTLNANDVKKA